MRTAICTVAVLVMIASGCGMDKAESAVRSKLPAGAREILDNAEQIELLSLDPSYPKPVTKEQFHNWPVLGSTQLTGKRKQEAIAIVERGIDKKRDFMIMCFLPRHGIRATYRSKTVELVICFHCLRMHVNMGSETESLPLNGSGQAELDALLTAANVPLAPKL